MKKDLILIIAHCNSKEKKKMLFDFLYSIQKYRETYDVMLSTHLPIDDYCYDFTDYVFYNKDNPILIGGEYSQNGWFAPKENYITWSSYLYKNTHAAILSLLIPSISLAKSLGYQKIHKFEYDTILNSDDEINHNSELLNDYDYVIYSNKQFKMVGTMSSFRTDGIIDIWKEYNLESIKKLYENLYPKIPEDITYNLISKTRKFFSKDLSAIDDKKIELGLMLGNKFYYDYPFYEPKENRLKFISSNLHDREYNIKVIVNGELKVNHNSMPKHWKMFDLLENFSEVFYIKVFRDDVKVLDIPLYTEESKQTFIKYNSRTSKK